MTRPKISLQAESNYIKTINQLTFTSYTMNIYSIYKFILSHIKFLMSSLFNTKKYCVHWSLTYR